MKIQTKMNTERRLLRLDRAKADSNEFQREIIRLASFKDWPMMEIPPEILAREGFLYTGIAYIIRCIFCNEIVDLCNANPLIKEYMYHRNIYCIFLNVNLKKYCTNIPKKEDSLDEEICFDDSKNIIKVDSEIEQLIKYYDDLKKAKYCNICKEKIAKFACLPCGHLSCCKMCISSCRICCVCRVLIRATVKVFYV